MLRTRSWYLFIQRVIVNQFFVSINLWLDGISCAIRKDRAVSIKSSSGKIGTFRAVMYLIDTVLFGNTIIKRFFSNVSLFAYRFPNLLSTDSKNWKSHSSNFCKNLSSWHSSFLFLRFYSACNKSGWGPNLQNYVLSERAKRDMAEFFYMKYLWKKYATSLPSVSNSTSFHTQVVRHLLFVSKPFCRDTESRASKCEANITVKLID